MLFGTEHLDTLTNLSALRERVRDAVLTFNPMKCDISKSRVTFLEHIVFG